MRSRDDARSTTGCLVDLHVHTRHMSLDSGLAPHVALERARERGLDAVCITEHNNIWPAEYAARLAELHEISILRGMEVSTDAGHVLVFGLSAFTLEMYRLERLHAIARSEGAALVLAHPTRRPGFGRPWDEAPDLFDALECVNGDDHNRSSAYVLDMARGLGLPATGGSDAHSAPAVGRCATLFERDVLTEADFITALREGVYRPVVLDGEMARYSAPGLQR